MYFYLSGGSLFLFDRKVLRYFRKDGHKWRKKKDGKTVKEAHEKLKVTYRRHHFLYLDFGCLYNRHDLRPHKNKLFNYYLFIYFILF